MEGAAGGGAAQTKGRGPRGSTVAIHLPPVSYRPGSTSQQVAAGRQLVLNEVAVAS